MKLINLSKIKDKSFVINNNHIFIIINYDNNSIFFLLQIIKCTY